MFQMFFKLIVLETIIASSIEDFAMNSELNKLKSFVKKKSYLNETIYAINTKIDHSPKCDNLCAKGSINHATDHFTCFMIKNGYWTCQCKEGFYLTENGDCYPCGSLCSICKDQGKTCLSCLDPIKLEIDMNAPYSCICKNNGLFENSSCHPQARQLQFCDANCLTCMRGVCVLCADLTYYPLGNKCFLCPDGSSSNNDGATCSTCHDSDCKICSGNGDKDCTLCRTLSLQDGKCACDPGYYKEEDSCVNCDPSCATCSGDGTNNCTSCLGPYSPSELNSCSCLTNEFEIQTDPLVCGQCHTSCLTCADSDMDSCLTCKDPEIPDIGNKRACSCLENQYISSKDPFTCNSCHISCKGCIDETSCISCENPKILQDNSCVCPGGYALVDNECVECDKGCSKCNKQPYNCTNCITPYVLYETLCICPENKNCGGSTNEPDQEYLKLTDKFENDLISLIFSEDLVSPLDSSNLGVKTISGIEILTSFELRTISGSQYQISIRFDPKYFSVKADLRLTFIDPIYSIRGLRLETYVYTYSITDHDYSPDTVASEILSKLSTANSRKSIPPASISASVANSFYAKDISFMWTYVNVAQILALMPLQNIKIPSNIKKIWIDFIPYSWFPNLGKLIYGDTDFDEKPIDAFYEFGYKSGLFIICSGHMIFLCLVFFCFWGVFKIIQVSVKIKKLQKIMEVLELKFTYSAMIRLWLEIFNMLFIGVIIAVNTPDMSRGDFITDQIVAWEFLIFGILLNGWLFWILFKNQTKVYSKDKDFLVRYNSLIGEFKNDKGYLSICYYPIYLLRRLLFLFILYHLADFPMAQAILNAVLCMVISYYLWYYQPFKGLSINQVNFYAELMLTFSFLLTIPYTFDDLPDWIGETTELILVIMIFTFLFYSYVILIKNIIIEIKKKVEERRRKKVSCQTGVFDFQATDKNSTDKDNENRAESNKSNIISSNDLDSENFIENPKIINFNAVISSEAHDSNESVYMNTLVVYEEN